MDSRALKSTESWRSCWRKERGRAERQQNRRHAATPLAPGRRAHECWYVVFVRLAQPMFCSSLPGLKRMVRPGGMRTSLPVRGLRRSTLSGLYLKNAKASQLNAFAPLHRVAHRLEDGVHRQLGLHLGDVGHPRDSFTMSTLIMRRLVVPSISVTSLIRALTLSIRKCFVWMYLSADSAQLLRPVGRASPCTTVR